MTLSPAVAALAAADFSGIVPHFVRAGFSVSEPAAGIVQIVSDPSRASVLLSVGVHGDETAPIELLAHLLDTLARQPHQLAVNLMIVVGNIAAIRQARRFIDVDLNRLFCRERGALSAVAEALRADELMLASRAFFARAAGTRLHLDLHTAIRDSLYPTFAMIPHGIATTDRQALIALLGHAGIAAVILNRSAASTFSAYTAAQLGAASATVELGQISALGDNDPGRFAQTSATLARTLRGDSAPTLPVVPMVFEVVQEIIKHSEAFQMSFDGTTGNFTALPRDAVIATDGAHEYRVGHDEELVVFPNPAVRVGFRAGLMVVRCDMPALFGSTR
ncbi:MAG: succinylglutamate desuccinylase [Burkholderiaceae bacterium]|jgi:succinylglutamate desuccinylase